ncbi:uncharacterized protein LOC134913925 isoform X2 [Pseudophryne corroboree]|uniref:uncharacterized protein LOC134913925 isoform X2 n=1 Tax=Pseudophryne corroboree TaxID=495146 RepID=UPI0030816881
MSSATPISSSSSCGSPRTHRPDRQRSSGIDCSERAIAGEGPPKGRPGEGDKIMRCQRQRGCKEVSGIMPEDFLRMTIMAFRFPMAVGLNKYHRVTQNVTKPRHSR